jgi:hypothetical protein
MHSTERRAFSRLEKSAEIPLQKPDPPELNGMKKILASVGKDRYRYWDFWQSCAATVSRTS